MTITTNQTTIIKLNERQQSTVWMLLPPPPPTPPLQCSSSGKPQFEFRESTTPSASSDDCGDAKVLLHHLFNFFQCTGLNATHWNVEENIFMRDAASVGLPPIATCALHTKAFMQVDVELPMGFTVCRQFWGEMPQGMLLSTTIASGRITHRKSKSYLYEKFPAHQ